MTAAPVLEVDNLTVALRTARGMRRAVDGVSFTIGEGEILGVAGESGSGKTITALSLLGLLPIGARTSGSVRFQGRELLGLSRKQLREVRGKQVALVSQDPATSLHPLLRIDVQMTEHVRAHLGFSKEQARQRAHRNARRGADPRPRSRPFLPTRTSFRAGCGNGSQLPWRSPASRGCWWPTSRPPLSMSPCKPGSCGSWTSSVENAGVSVMIITHDLGVMSTVSDRICVLYGGKVAEYGVTGSVLGQPRHPYTEGLMRSLPSASEAGSPMVPIQGAPPSLDTMPGGCAFHPRCIWARESCRLVVPTLRVVEGGRLAGVRHRPPPRARA